MSTVLDLSAHETNSFTGHPSWWEYEFPNGRAVNVVARRDVPFRFDVEAEDDTYAEQSNTYERQTTEQVEALLATVAGLGRAEVFDE